MRAVVAAVALLSVLGCVPRSGSSSEQAQAPPDPFVTNYGVCFSRDNLVGAWMPYQDAENVGTLSWFTVPWGFGFVAPLTLFDLEPTADPNIAQDTVLVSLDEFSTAEPPPRSAQSLIYDRGYSLSDQPSPIPAFHFYQPRIRRGWYEVMLVSEDERVAVECTALEAAPPNPTCTVHILGPHDGLRTLIHIPRRALPKLPEIVREGVGLMRSLEVACPSDATPTFRYEPGRLFLPDTSR